MRDKKNVEKSKLLSCFIIIILIITTLSAFLITTVPVCLADVTEADVTVTPSTAGAKNATYSINFNVGEFGNLTENVDWIKITFPGDTNVNQTAGVEGNVSNGTSIKVITNFTILNNNLTLNITIPVNISYNGQVWINLTQGINNPTNAITYNLLINTSKEPNSVNSTGYKISAGDAYYVAVSDVVSNVPAGVVFDFSDRISGLVDEFGNIVANDNYSVFVESNMDGELFNESVAFVDGTPYDDINITFNAAENHSLKVNVSGAVNYSNVTVIPNDVDNVEIVANNSTTITAGASLNFLVWVNDSCDNIITSDPANDSLVWMNATNGVFNYNTSGVYGVNVSYLGVDSNVVNVTVNANFPTHIYIVVQPSNTAVGIPISDVVVQVNDTYGNAVVGLNLSVFLNKGSFAGGKNWSVTNVSGFAVFDDLVISVVDVGYNLTFNLSGVCNETSFDFDVVNMTIPPNNFTATPLSSNQINLEWVKGSNADNTYIRRKKGSYPTDRSDGLYVCNETGLFFLDSGLSSSTTYYYRAWSWNSTTKIWSIEYVNASAKTKSSGSGGVVVPQPTNPTAKPGGPYTGIVGTSIQFDGSASFAISGRTITSYSWKFGDGATGIGTNTTHIYTTESQYTVVLTVTDSQGQIGTATTTATISLPPSQTVSEETKSQIENTYGITLNKPFYANDTDSDGVINAFTDPNQVLTNVNTVNINGHTCFLISTNNGKIPEFFWDIETNTITPITYAPAQITKGPVTNKIEQTITIEITVDKTDWIYLVVTDQYPDYTLNIKTSDGRIISSDMIWRKNGKIYVLDDPTTIYDLVYQYTIMEPIFNPATQATLKTSKPTITITYQEQVTIISALLNDQNIINQIASTNQISFVYMPSSDLKDGTYLLSITAEDQSGNKLTSTAIYTISTELSSVQNAVIIALIIIIIIAIIILILLYKKGLIFK